MVKFNFQCTEHKTLTDRKIIMFKIFKDTYFGQKNEK